MTRLNRLVRREQRAVEETTALQLFVYAREVVEEVREVLDDVLIGIRDCLETATLMGFIPRNTSWM